MAKSKWPFKTGGHSFWVVVASEVSGVVVFAAAVVAEYGIRSVKSSGSSPLLTMT